jgi:hypothetical protein
MDNHKNAPLIPKGREAMVRSVLEKGLSKAAAARKFTNTPMSQIGTTIQDIRIGSLGRETVIIPWSGVSSGDTVTVQVWGGARPRKGSEIAWNVYPESAYATMTVA